MKSCKIKRLFNGFASVRSYIVEDCIKNNEGLQILYGGETMTITHAALSGKEPFQIHKKEFTSKFSGESYELYDFKFKPDEGKQLNLLGER
jgi:hypothetical protein